MRNPFRQGGRLIAAALLVSLTLAGCGSDEAAAPAPPPPPPAEAVPVTKPFDGLRPTQVRIPKINADSSLISVTVNTEGEMAVPSAKQPMQAAWYRLSPVPGETGPAILLGHVDGNKQPGIFFKLHELAEGDEILVNRSDGKELKFTVTKKQQVPKDRFPSDEIYADTTGPELRVITCGGVFDKEEHSYKDNVVIWAKLV
ncbi:class F sortase [Amycolatopsis suaedae]|uniref:Class F sortase n=1 Tax=Amycolatopsis suaedae TaxID=2510978 RepID=A0A4Q7J5I0_9PSEU|nr:class F sortase [Amycolatopsis suaedae]RZQ62108.1 class F sortase [Amycolatopsis suaedae]